jgi:ubiquinone/menaquinone biosynthesis C-methylase UbiE
MATSHRNEDLAGPTFPRRLLLRFLRLFFKLLYHQFSWTYDFVAWLVSVGSWNKWVEAVIPYLDGPKILEIGFGPGHLQHALQQNNASVYGIDESNQMVHIARRRLAKLGFRPNLIQGDALHLPFGTESFNQVVMTFPAEFIINRLTLVEIRRVLVHGGSALIIPLAWITGRMPWERLAAWVNKVTGESPPWDSNVLDPLKEAGFEVDWEMINFPNSKVLLVRLVKN